MVKLAETIDEINRLRGEFTGGLNVSKSTAQRIRQQISGTDEINKAIICFN